MRAQVHIDLQIEAPVRQTEVAAELDHAGLKGSLKIQRAQLLDCDNMLLASSKRTNRNV